jgi:hypothetical protein
MDPATGVISGSPTNITPKANYTVTATNAGGSTTASLSIVVNDVAPSIAYQSPYYAFTASIATQQTIKPNVTGGAVVSWSVNPALPAGLALSTTDGSISGTPTAAATPGTYVVTAANSGGKSTASLTIAVAGAPLLDLGHVQPIVFIRATSSRVLSMDGSGHWVLKDYASGATLASGDNTPAYQYQPMPGQFINPPVDLAGNTLIDVVPSGAVEVRSATDGHLLATLAGPYSWTQLSSDGSFISTGSTTALAAWSTSGQALLSRPGDYSKALTFSAPGTIQVALGAAGQNVIETVSVATNASTISPAFQGTFNSWFVDGARFLTTLANTVWTYSSTGTQQDITQLSQPPHLTGQGNWFWNYSPSMTVLSFYQVGASSSPALTKNIGTLALPLPSGNTVGILNYGAGTLTVTDLSGTIPTSTDYSVPIAQLSAYATASSTTWLVGNTHGVILDGASIASQPRYLTLGSAWSIAAGTNYFSVATAAGRIFTFDSSTNALVNTIDFPSSQLSASASGTILAALANTNDYQYEPDRTLNIYTLPSGTVASTFPGSVNSPPYLSGMSLSGSGTVLTEYFTGGSGGCKSEVVAVAGGAPIWCDTTGVFNDVKLSPDGTLIAALKSLTVTSPTPTTSLYKNGTLVTAVPGLAVGWLDNGRVLATTYSNTVVPQYTVSAIYDSLGNVLSTAPLPQMQAIDVATSNSVYSPALNEILSLTTGAATWASAQSPTLTGTGAITGSQVIFASGSAVLAQPY